MPISGINPFLFATLSVVIDYDGNGDTHGYSLHFYNNRNKAYGKKTDRRYAA